MITFSTYAIKIAQRSPEWHELRKYFWGASEVPALLGKVPYKNATPEKTIQAKLHPVPFKDTESTIAGRYLESGIIGMVNHYHADRIGQVVVPEVSVIVAPALRLIVSIDAVIGVDGTPVEIKNVGERQREAWERGGPEHYFYQAQTQSFILDTPACFLAGCIGGKSIKLYKYAADPRVRREIANCLLQHINLLPEIPPKIQKLINKSYPMEIECNTT